MLKFHQRNYLNPRLINFKVDEIPNFKPNFQNGKLAATACFTCHRINEEGIDYGPDLTNLLDPKRLM